MPRYFFDTADGDNDADEEGVELGGDDEAIRQAICYAGAMIQDDPGLLFARDEFIVTARRNGETAIAEIRVQLTKM